MPQVAVLEESSKSLETASDFWVGVFLINYCRIMFLLGRLQLGLN